ncbi:unnamed protein product [Strongylus vulgaris]|uniref:Uncharacterized protein n=1 Tax=Strongylus vulgaris TaxID=40348 RepID=A0A3P7IX07_STRVU|nr:unnamed protein product [Strongylus vulgaris]
MESDLSNKPTSCLSTCRNACQSSCAPQIPPAECRSTCDSTCAEVCSSSTTPPPTLVNIEPTTYPSTDVPRTQTTAASVDQTQTAEPLKINIKLLPPPYEDLQQKPASPSTPSPFLQCLRQCDIGCQQSCRQRSPLPSEDARLNVSQFVNWPVQAVHHLTNA